MGKFEHVVELPAPGYVITAEMRKDAREKFLVEALAKNPNGTQGEPWLDAIAMDGVNARFIFGIETVEPKQVTHAKPPKR